MGFYAKKWIDLTNLAKMTSLLCREWSIRGKTESRKMHREAGSYNGPGKKRWLIPSGGS